MSDAPDSTRGVADRGTSRASARERNVPRGEVHAVIPDHTYNIVGFDIGSAELSKRGFKAELEPVVQQIRARMGQSRHPVIRITGHASDSRFSGKGPEVYADQRAIAVKTYLVNRGVPPEWIEIKSSRPTLIQSASGVDAPSEAKALARSATLEIGAAEAHRDVADRFGDITYSKGQTSARFQPPRSPNMPDLSNRRWRILDPFVRGMEAGAKGLLAGGMAVVRALALTVDEVIAIAGEIAGKAQGPNARDWVQKRLDESVDQHHIMVQQLIDWFAAVGVDVHEDTQFVPRSYHNWLHSTGWNLVWRVFFELYLTETGALPTAKEVKDFADQMIKHWGTGQLPREPYLKAAPRK